MHGGLGPLGQRLQGGQDVGQVLPGGVGVGLHLLGEVELLGELRHLGEEVDHLRQLAEDLDAGLQAPLEDVQVHVRDAGLFIPGHGRGGELLRGHAADVLGVHPAQLLDVEDRGGLGEPLQREGLHQLGEREELAVVAGVPADQGDVVEQRLLEVTLFDEVAVVGVAVALGELAVLVLHDRGQVDVDRLLPAKGLVEQVVLGRGGEVLVAAQHVGDAHGVVVDDVGEVIGGHAVGLDEDVVVQLGAVHGDVAVEHVVKGGLARLGHVLPDDVGDARVELGLDLLGGKVQAVLVVLPGLALGLGRGAALGQLLLGAEAVVGLALCDQLLGVGQVHVLALGLDVRAVVAADVRSLVPEEAAVAQRVVDDLRCAGHEPLLVRVLDAQDELAVVLLGEEIGIERRAQAAQVQIPGGAWRESRANVHVGRLLAFTRACSCP